MKLGMEKDAARRRDRPFPLAEPFEQQLDRQPADFVVVLRNRRDRRTGVSGKATVIRASGSVSGLCRSQRSLGDQICDAFGQRRVGNSAGERDTTAQHGE
jgi:hypothetical protein